MGKRTYTPDRGDPVEMNVQPAAGREIDKRRPAIVLTPAAYNRRSGLCLAVPTSTDLTPGPLWIPVPAGLSSRPSLVLCDYLKNDDYRERSATFLAKVDATLVDQIVANVLDLIDPIP